MKLAGALQARAALAFLAAMLLCGGFTGIAHAASATFSCTVKDVFVYSSRVHVQCTTTTTDGSASIRYFAVSTSDATLANRLMTMGTTAIVSGRRFVAMYTTGDTSGSSWGCSADDCRRVTGFGIE